MTCGRALPLALTVAVRLTFSSPPLGLDQYMPVPDNNPITTEKIDIGRRLFFDRRLSRDGTTSCATCHDPENGFADSKPLAIGVEGRRGRRNSPTIVNRGYGRSFFWDERAASLEDLVLQPIEDADELGSSVEVVSQNVGIDRHTIVDALATYVRSVVSGDSRFDRFAAGQQSALTMDEQRGLRIFRGKGHCTGCHIGPNFTDERSHNTGVAWDGDRFIDLGTGDGAFKTPTLREVARTAPYMHNGSLATLGDVIDFYDRGGRPNPNIDPELRVLHLTADEKAALTAFLRSLSGTVTSLSK